ncbi:MAG: tRNA glutamyl-Q(34) synthetase GluQRS [Steroidobacteraceae bacterium]
MKSSTATGTTATAEAAGHYRGRFAPSPTGLLHIGSLAAALASWLDARAHGGAWLVRMEDLDRPRNRPGSAAALLATLDALGLTPDEPVQYQSQRRGGYLQAFTALRERGLLYRCTCSRSETLTPYPGTCRDAAHPEDRPGAWRLRLPEREWCFSDRFQGPVRFSSRQLGDPVLLRRDGIVAYQLAVVVDDLAQGITDVVRGADLLDSTPWQLALIEMLGAPAPRYAHVPLISDADGRKLAKSRHSLPLDALAPGRELLRALRLLRQHPPPDLATAAPAAILEWAIDHWAPGNFARQRHIDLSAARD